MNAVQTPQNGIVDCLLKQNLYQRLGLKTNIVSLGELESAYRSRVALLRDNPSGLTVEELRHAKKLLDEAILTLRISASRYVYDEKLMANTTASSDCSTFSQTAARPDCQSSPGKSLNESDLAGRYSVQHLLADGPRCKVYSAVDNHLKRRVIVKQIQPHLFAKKSHQEMFYREARLFASSNASNLVKILDFDDQTGSMVVEQMSQDLSQWMKKRESPCEPNELREILRGALTGLAALHDQGIAHGRIEPGHLFLDDSGSVKLSVTPGMTGVSTTLRPGPETRHVAPELLNAKVFGPAGLPADLYALGFLTIELLSGKELARMVNPAIEAQGSSNNGWLLWHASPTDMLPPLSAMLPGLPQDLIQLLTQMTSKRQQNRIGSARECLDLLRQQSVDNRSHVTNSPVSCQPIVTEGVEMLGGLPPCLHEQYQDQVVITWTDVLNQPKLLFQPKARSKLITVAMVSVGSAATLLLMLAGSPKELEPTSVMIAAGTHEKRDILRHSDEPVQEPSKPQSDIWSEPASAPAEPNLASPASASNQPDAPSVKEEAGLDSSDYIIPVRTEPKIPEPPTFKQESDDKPRFYSPTHPSFEVLGAETNIVARDQSEAMKKALRMVIDNGYQPYRGALPYRVNDERVVDPRASLALAWLAYQKNDKDSSKIYALKAMDDAKSLKAPYVMPQIFLSYLLVEKNTTLVYCQDALQWNWHQWLVQSDPRYKDAATTMVWWIGILTGFVEEAKGSAIASGVDTQGAEQLVRSLVSADIEVFEKYDFARSAVKDRLSELNSLRFTQEIKRFSSRRVSHVSQANLPLSLSQSNRLGSIDYSSEIDANWGSTAITQNLNFDNQPLSSDDQEDKKASWKLNPKVASTVYLASFQPLDLSAMAYQTLSTLRQPTTLRAKVIARTRLPEFASSSRILGAAESFTNSLQSP